MSIGNGSNSLMVMDKNLADLIQERIDDAYGGSQAEFSRATGFTKQAVSSWLKGKAAVPQIDARRRLARELGISHLDLLIAVGEIDTEEVERAGIHGVVDERPVPLEIGEVLKDIRWTPRTTAGLLAMLRMMRDIPEAGAQREG